MRYEKKQSHGKYDNVLWLVLIIAILGISFGGVRAYLTHSAENPVTNSFAVDTHPVVLVDEYSVTVDSSNYPVYLRAAVLLNWRTQDGAILAVVPTGYTLTTSTGWSYNTNDGFYYYSEPVSVGDTIPPVIESLEAPGAGEEGYQSGCTLVADLTVQAVQAVGYADNGNTAVEDAWGWTPTLSNPTETAS